MTYTKLVHKDPKANDKVLHYRLVDDTHPDYYYATIWGNGIVNSCIHAVPKSNYTLEEVKEKKSKDSVSEDISEFI